MICTGRAVDNVAVHRAGIAADSVLVCHVIRAANGRDVGSGVSLGQFGAFVPRLSAFHGIVVYMYIRDHGVGHFHARYGEHEAVLAVASDQVLEGRLPRRQLAMVREWARLHRAELAAAWQKAALGEPPGTIEPLP